MEGTVPFIRHKVFWHGGNATNSLVSSYKAMQFVLVTKSFKFVRKRFIFLYMAKLYSTMSFM